MRDEAEQVVGQSTWASPVAADQLPRRRYARRATENKFVVTGATLVWQYPPTCTRGW